MALRLTGALTLKSGECHACFSRALLYHRPDGDTIGRSTR